MPTSLRLLALFAAASTACEPAVEPPPAPVGDPAQASPESAAVAQHELHGRPPPGHPPGLGLADPNPPPSEPPPVLEGADHPMGTILGLARSQAMGPDSSDLVYPQEKLQRMASPSLDSSRKPLEVVRLLGLEPGMAVADVGAGSGYYAWHFSKAVGPEGRVWATDIMLDNLEFTLVRMEAEPPPYPNVLLVLHDRRDVLLPSASVDLAFLSNVHYFYDADHVQSGHSKEEVTRFYGSIYRALKPGGRLAIIERDTEHGGTVTRDEITEQLRWVGFEPTASHDIIESDWFLVYQRAEGAGE